MQKTLLFILLIASLSACNNSEKMSEVEENGFKVEYSRDKTTKQKQGAYTRFYASGAKYEEGTFVKDSLDGERKFYLENGKIQNIETFKNGRYEGVYKAFYKDGTLEQEGQYVNDEMSGEWKTYYKNGQLKETVNFAHNLENGVFKEFYPDGKVKTEGAYANGDTENGELKEYHKNGELLRIAMCDNGICRTTWAADTTKFTNR